MVHIVTYWLSCLFFMTIDACMDITNDSIYRIVANTRLKHPPSVKKINSAIWVSVANQVLALPVALLMAPYCVTPEQDSNIVVTLSKLVFYALVADQWFYWTHRIIHQRWLYANIHSIHHQWIYPMALSTLYAHPIEHIIGNIGSFLIGPLIWTSQSSLLAFWIVLATSNAVSGHSGIHFPMFSIEKHDLHHRLLNCNYGTTGLSDRMYGTRKFIV